LRRERLLVAIVILFTCTSYFFIQYDKLRTGETTLEQTVQAFHLGMLPAPVQYRIGIPFLIGYLKQHTHMELRQSGPLVEALSYAACLWFLYGLFSSSARVKAASDSNRAVLLAFFLAITQFPILWIFPWERAETLPTALYLAAVVVLVACRNRIPFPVLSLLIVALSLGQGLMRADVPVVLGVALLLSAAMAIPLPRSRSSIAILGLLASAIGAGVQFYLQRVAYPNAQYPPTTAKIQLFNNLSLEPPLHIPEFLIALLPFFATLFLLRRYRLHLEAQDKLVLLICLLYLPVWVIDGLIVEVRIFIPFLLLASPTMAKLWTAFLLREDNDKQPALTASPG
jgi:hypothetical protein